MSNNFLRKLFWKIGIDIHKYHSEPDRLSWLKDLNINTILDIGANVGQFAKEIRNSLLNVKLYSFEPIKSCHQKLNEEMMSDRNFKSFNFALGETNSQTIINVSSYSPSSSLLKMADSHKNLFPHTKDSQSESIEVRRLDDVWSKLDIRKNILIKVDTQGYEDKVITGGIKSFSEAKIILIEASFVRLYENQPLFDDIYEKIKSLGFTYHGALHQKINKKTGEVIFEDAIFIK